jgi:predicted dehydrogenase
MNRRTFLATASSGLVATRLSAAAPRMRRAAVIGHTGRGNYGHGLDVVWQKAGAEVVGVADADAKGLKKTLAKLKVKRGFSDYRKMLRELKPEFVSVAPRHADQHFDMTLAAIRSGAKGVYVEKPFCRTPAEADQLIKAAAENGTKIAVAHRNRFHPVLPIIDQFIAAGELGRLLEIRGHGLGDRRGGGEDLWVLGSHIFNLFNYFGGEPKSCSGILLQNGRPVLRKDVKPGSEGLGLLAGNEIHARWHMTKGIIASYTTFPNDGSNKTGYATHLVGTKGTISIHIDRDPVAWLSPGNSFNPASRSKPRIPITSAGVGKPETQPELIASVHNHVLAVRDLISAVDADRSPLCDIREGATVVEMICGVFESHRQGGAHVNFPLTERENPLSKL